MGSVSRQSVSSDRKKNVYTYTLNLNGQILITGTPNFPFYTGGNAASTGKYFQDQIPIDPNIFLSDIQSVQYRWRPNFDGIDGVGVNWDVILKNSGPMMVANSRTGQCVYIGPNLGVIPQAAFTSAIGPNEMMICGVEPFYASVNDSLIVLLDSVVQTTITNIPLGKLDLMLADFDIPPYKETTGLEYIVGV